jgi:hypothetical protein
VTENDPASIRPIVELFRPDCTAFWATTFNIELAFFNGYLLRRLGEPPLNAVVIADQRCLDNTLERSVDRLDLLAAVNRRWLLRSVRLGHGRFHPKSYLAVTGRSATLLVGSGNLSHHGIDTGREVFVTFRSGSPTGDAAIATWRTWMRQLIATIGDIRLAERFTDLDARLPASIGPGLIVEPPLLHNLSSPLADQLIAAVGERQVDELIATAPFYDEHGEALGRLVDRLRPARIALYTTTSTSVDGNRLHTRLDSAGGHVTTYAYLPDTFTHAKLIGVITGDTGWIMSGSANLSHAALTLTATTGNVELAVLAATTADVVRNVFVPPGVVAEERPLASLGTLKYDPGDEADGTVLPARLERASLLPDGRVQLAADVSIEPTWRLSDHDSSVGLDFTASTATTSSPIVGPLVRLTADDRDPVSNWCVIEDPVALANILHAGDRTTPTSRPAELTTADLDSPLGRALLLMHCDMVMDITERAPTAGAGEIGQNEATAGESDDDLWGRLERETLERDPRAASYARLLAQTASGTTGLTEPIVELLDAMRHRVPLTDSHGNRLTLIQLLTPPARDPDRGGHQWTDAARIRLRARNVLRRWAAAQTDPRLEFIDPLAPLGNLLVVTTIFLKLWPYTLGTEDGPPELDASDLDDLWARWFRPFVGTGNNDGWLDRVDTTSERFRTIVNDQLTENITALCWLAIRPGADRRARVVAWQPSLQAAFDKGLINDTDDVANYLTRATGMQLTANRVAGDLADSLMFIDDDLWCETISSELGLVGLGLDAPEPGQNISVRLDVPGIPDPLLDPRLPRLIVAVRQYRSADAVALYSADHEWRIVFEADQPAAYLPHLGADLIESIPIAPSDLERMVADRGVLADVFPRAARVA